MELRECLLLFIVVPHSLLHLHHSVRHHTEPSSPSARCYAGREPANGHEVGITFVSWLRVYLSRLEEPEPGVSGMNTQPVIDGDSTM